MELILIKRVFHTAHAAGCTIGNQYAAACERGGKSIADLLGGRLISKELAEKIATEALKVLPIALFFLALTPTLSVTSMVLIGAVSSTAILACPNYISQNGKVRVLEGGGLALALQTILSVGYSLLTFSPISAIGTILVGSMASAAAFYASRKA